MSEDWVIVKVTALHCHRLLTLLSANTLKTLNVHFSVKLVLHNQYYTICVGGCERERDREAEEGRLEPRLLVTQGHSMAQHLIWRETEPSVWHRICFQEITTFLYFSTTVHGRRQKKDRESECKSFVFLPNLCLHALPQTSTQTCSGPETLITSACVLFWLFTACRW